MLGYLFPFFISCNFPYKLSFFKLWVLPLFEYFFVDFFTCNFFSVLFFSYSTARKKFTNIFNEINSTLKQQINIQDIQQRSEQISTQAHGAIREIDDFIKSINIKSIFFFNFYFFLFMHIMDERRGVLKLIQKSCKFLTLTSVKIWRKVDVQTKNIFLVILKYEKVITVLDTSI